MIAHWWIDQLPPVPGLVRAVFYLGLLALCILDHPSPLDAPRLIARTERRFYTPPTALRVLGLEWVQPAVLRAVRALTILVWVGAAVGFLEPITGVLTFLGFAFLHAVNSGALGSNHSTHSALYALFCMCFVVSYDGPTADSWLAEHGTWITLGKGTVLQSSFGTTLLLVALAYVMFAGGICKLRNGGLRWLDGSSLRFYITESAEFARAPFLARLFGSRPRLCRVLAVLSAVIELSAPLVLLDPVLRLPFVLAWCALHIGILLVMMPAYWVQMWCYVLLLDWYAIGHAVTGHGFAAPASPATTGPAAIALSVLGCGFAATLILVLVRQVEQWPFTSVPMYSNGVPPQALVLPAPHELRQRAAAAAGGRVSAWQRPWVSTEILEDVRLVPRQDGEAVPLFEAMAEPGVRFVRWSQYAKVVRAVAIADIAAKTDPGETAPEYPAGRFLADIATLVRASLPQWERYQRIELICNTSAGWIVTGRAELATAGGPTDRSESRS